MTDLLSAETLLFRAACLNGKPLIADLFIGMNVLVGFSYAAIAVVLLFDRAAATRAMFDNRVAFGGFIVFCAWSRLLATIMLFAEIYWLEAATVVATSVVAIAVAWLTLRTLKITRAGPR